MFRLRLCLVSGESVPLMSTVIPARGASIRVVVGNSERSFYVNSPIEYAYFQDGVGVPYLSEVSLSVRELFDDALWSSG